MSGALRHSIVAIAAALLATTATGACASGHTHRGADQQMIVHLTNDLAPPSDVTVYAVTRDGTRRLLGDVPPNKDRVLKVPTDILSGIELSNRGGAHRRTRDRVAAGHHDQRPRHDRLGSADERDVVPGTGRVALSVMLERSARYSARSAMLGSTPNRTRCRNRAGGDGNDRQHRSDRQEHERVVRRLLVQEWLHPVSRGERDRDPDADPRQAKAQPFAEHHAQHVAGMGAKRNAEPELVGSLRDVVRDYAVQADRGENRAREGRRRGTSSRPCARIRGPGRRFRAWVSLSRTRDPASAAAGASEPLPPGARHHHVVRTSRRRSCRTLLVDRQIVLQPAIIDHVTRLMFSRRR